MQRKTLLAVCELILPWPATGQSPSGSISGSVLGPDGKAVPNAPIRAVNATTSMDARTYSSSAGTYELRNLPVGTYVVSVATATPCCAFTPYANDSITVAAAQAVELMMISRAAGAITGQQGSSLVESAGVASASGFR
jgi:hypothetical protein